MRIFFWRFCGEAAKQLWRECIGLFKSAVVSRTPSDDSVIVKFPVRKNWTADSGTGARVVRGLGWPSDASRMPDPLCSTSRSPKVEDLEGLKICSLPEKFYPYLRNLYTGFRVLGCLWSVFIGGCLVFETAGLQTVQDPLIQACNVALRNVQSLDSRWICSQSKNDLHSGLVGH